MGRAGDISRLRALARALQPGRRVRIADVGANPINENPYAALAEAGLAEVWCFEPAPEAFEALTLRAKEWETYFPHAVGAGGPATLNVCKGGGYSSLLTPNLSTLDFLGRWHRLMRVVDRVEVQTVRLDDLEDLPSLDVLKIDIQGAELDVFQGARGKLSRAMAVITEVAFVPLYQDQPLLDQQMAELGSQGFLIHKFLHTTARPLLGQRSEGLSPRHHRNQLIDGDAAFVRDFRGAVNWSDEELKFLALIADGVLGSHDLALRAIDLLVDRGAVGANSVEDYMNLVPGRAPAEQGANA